MIRWLSLLALLFASPAWASRDCVDSTDSLVGTLAATYGVPLTIAMYTKIADHPASSDFVFNLAAASDSNNPSVYLSTSGTADQYFAVARNSSGTTGAASHTAAAGEYDGGWMGWLGVFTSTTSRDIYVDAVANTGGNTNNIDVGTALQHIRLCTAMNTFAAYAGKVAEIAIFDSALSTADITDYLDNRTAANCLSATPVAYYPLDTSSLSDESGNGEGDLTSNGADFDADHPTITGCGGIAPILYQYRQRRN